MTASKAAGVAGAMLLLCSCSHHAQVVQIAQVAPSTERHAENAVDVGDGDYQTKSLRERLVAEPANLEVRLALADRYGKAGVPELAIEHYRFASEKFPDNAKVPMLLARALRDFHRPDQAIATLVRFCDRNPKQPADLLSLLGILEDDAGEFQDAEIAYRAAAAQSPDRSDVLNNLGYNLLLQGKPAEAIEQFEAALTIEPHSQIAHNNLGIAILAQWKDDTQPRDALLHWQSVSDPATAHNNLASILMEQKRYADARKELGYALDYQKDHEAALSNLKLLAQLDGGPKVPEPAARNSLWKRVKTVFTKQKQAPAEQSAANLH
jgi:Tfp pilus assembly protein PilF